MTTKHVICVAAIMLTATIFLCSCNENINIPYTTTKSTVTSNVTSNNSKINIDDFCTFEVLGYNGYGKPYLYIDSDRFLYLIDDLELSNADKATAQRIIKNMTYSLSKEENAANNDVVKISLNYDTNALSEVGLDLTENEFSYRISGLPDVTVIDPFEGVILKYTGYSDDSTISLDLSNIDSVSSTYVKYQFGSANNNGHYKK